MNAHERCRIERRIATVAAKGLIAAGYEVAVEDGEKLVCSPTDDLADIIGAMFSTDEDRFIVWQLQAAPDAGEENKAMKRYEAAGWVHFVYGNGGWDVISDYTTNLESALQRANELADELGRRHS